MFIKVKSPQKENLAVTDVIAKDKKIIKYRALLNIIKTIHMLFFPREKAQQKCKY